MKKKGKVIINPLIGMKKKGDFKNEVLLKVFTNLITNNEYKNKVFFNPLVANMHYAGPREAIHHINLREMVDSIGLLSVEIMLVLKIIFNPWTHIKL